MLPSLQTLEITYIANNIHRFRPLNLNRSPVYMPPSMKIYKEDNKSNFEGSKPHILHDFREVHLMKAENFPLPGTAAARSIGCTCPESNPAEGTFDDPWILDIQCPWHGERAFEEHTRGARH